MLTNNPDSKHLAAIHALWIGLCVKVEALVEQIKQQESSADGKRI